MLNMQIDNKSAGYKPLDAVVKRMEKLDAEIDSLNASAAEVEAKLAAAFSDGTEAQLKALRADRDRIEEARAKLLRDRPMLEAAMERARAGKQAAEWESELTEQREIAERLRDVARRMEEAGHQVAKHWNEYEALFRENELLNQRAETMARRLKRDPLPPLVVDDVMGYPRGFRMNLSGFAEAVRNLNMSRKREADTKNQSIRHRNEREKMAFREGMDTLAADPPAERTYRIPSV